MRIENEATLCNRGVSQTQINLLDQHLLTVEPHIFRRDPGFDGALTWLRARLDCSLEPAHAASMYHLVQENSPDPKVEYLELGYDSCQSQRKLAKVVGEALLVGGILYESSLLGCYINLSEAQKIVGSSLKLNQGAGVVLASLARKFGGKQDFIFPGVTPSSPETPELEDLAIAALIGNPRTTVRSLTGLGGLRADRDWNFVTDFGTFVDLKVAEDKRYYPGIGLFYLFKSRDMVDFPVLAHLERTQPGAFTQVKSFVEGLKGISEQRFQGVSVLCSAYMPEWTEFKAASGFSAKENLDLESAFHSPSYDFSLLKKIFESIADYGIVQNYLVDQIFHLKQMLGHCWSFNSTIHLPWTSEQASLSNGLIGAITNGKGDFAVRYGVGYKGRSLEIRKYVFGRSRAFPSGLAGSETYAAMLYKESDQFQGQFEEEMLFPSHPLWQEIVHKGFMKAGLELLVRHK